MPSVVISEKLVVRPPFRDSPRPDLPEIVIDPGMAFGTGGHETTRLACGLALETLDSPPAGTPEINCAADIGCGTGVIAAALVRCGCRHVDACDLDPEAIKVSEEVLEANGILGSINLLLGSANILRQSYPLVVANILSDKLLGIASDIYGCIAPGGVLVLSGILVEEKEAFLAAFLVECPVKLLDSVQEGEWLALRLQNEG